ncbi:MAG: hypothetical protein DMF63_10240 [Acidobacteria bacterium]|nr:MAG: hypothetical protein DMF63_10240 [Acidobacteriota bacterium]
MIYSDKVLSQKLELTEARANIDFVESRAKLEPEIGATWIEIGGARAMFDGAQSPCTQTFGLGLFDEITGERLDEIEDFFRSRGAPVFHEVSPLADPAIIPLLNSRGYRPIEMSTVLFRELEHGVPPSGPAEPEGRLKPRLKTRIIEDNEADLWAATSAVGWSTEMDGLADFMFSFGRVSARSEGSYPFLAELDNKPVAAGMLFMSDDACILAGASTILEARNQGAQNALFAARLKFAVEHGCRLAMMSSMPGSQSQKNAQKNGFEIAYTRTKWHLTV